MKRYNESTKATITVRCFDRASQPVTPTTLRYRLDCLTSRRVIQDWTDLTPADTAVIEFITSIENRANAVERKAITVEADTGISTVFADDGEFEVRRLSGF